MLVWPQKKALVIKSRSPERITNIIPRSKLFSVKGQPNFVAVPHGLDEARVLRNMGYKAPAPIRHYYEWPGRYAPFLAQREAAAFLSMHKRAFNLSELGTGKSLASLWAYDYLRGLGKVKKALIISPLSTLERTWADEIFHHFPHLECAVLHGSKDKRVKLLQQDVDVYIINHDGVKIIEPHLKTRDDIDIIIIDEIAQAARNAGTDRWKAINKVVNRHPVSRWAWGMTGTPTPNSPTDAWAQCRIIVPDNVPPYFNRFKQQVMKQFSQFIWVPKAEATEIVNQVMQPAVRFTRDECLDLPPLMYETRTVSLTKEQDKAYKEMMTKLRAEASSGAITAVNEAVKMSKLIQIACVAEGTEVLTSRGWVPIQCVTRNDLVWDGVEWVRQEGAVFKGDKSTLTLEGARMTADHKVWVGEWVQAKEIVYGDARERFDRTAVRLPDGAASRWDVEEQPRDMGVPVRLREHGNTREPVPSDDAPQVPEKLRLPPREQNSWADTHAGVPVMDKYEASVPGPKGQRLGELRRAGHHGLRSVVGLVRGVLGRYGRGLQAWAHAGAFGQQRPLLAGELPMGNYYSAGEQPANQPLHRNPQGPSDSSSGCGPLRAKTRDVVQEAERRLVSGESVRPTYDLVNCGPRNRFVVRGKTGRAMIVHNCGVVYANDGSEVTLPSNPRIDEVRNIVAAAEGKVIVFVPYVSSVNMVAAELAKDYKVEVIHGGVKKDERDRIFGAFQKGKDPKVLVAQPAAMSHGLTLTAASTIVWYSCVTSNETFEQANGRINRPGQKMNNFIIMLEGTAVEKRIYSRLKNKQKMQGALLDEVKAGRDAVIA